MSTNPQTPEPKKEAFAVLKVNFLGPRSPHWEEPTYAANELAAIITVTNRLYKIICAGLDHPIHDVYVSAKLTNPEWNIEFKGIAEPSNALRELIESVPGVVASVYTIRSFRRAKKVELEAKAAQSRAEQAEAQRREAEARGMAEVDLLKIQLKKSQLDMEIAKLHNEANPCIEDLITTSIRSINWNRMPRT